MAAFDFREALSISVDEIKYPRSVPKCHLLVRTPNPGFEFGLTKGKGTPFVRWTFKDPKPGPDCTEELLEGIDLTDRTFRVDMWATPDAMYRIDRMLNAVLGPNSNKKTVFERLPDTNDMDMMILVAPRFDDQGNDTGYNDVLSVSAPPNE